MPIYELWRQATRSNGAATAFMCATLTIGLFTINAMQQTASRMTWALAQDGGLFGAKYLASIHPKLDVPVWSLVANAVVVLILGCIYLGSSVAFNAIIGCSIILQMISYCVPILLLMMPGKREECLPANRAFKVPKWVGLGANTVVVGFTVIEVVFFVFPPAIPVTRSSMSKSHICICCLSDTLTCGYRLCQRRTGGFVHCGMDQLVCLCEEPLQWSPNCATRNHQPIGAVLLNLDRLILSSWSWD